MGFLKKLFNAKLNKLGVNQSFSNVEKSDFVPERLIKIRAEMLAELRNTELSLLLKPEQIDGGLFSLEYSEKGKPFDELEFIIKNNVSSKQFLSNAKDCIIDLDEISTCDSTEQTKYFHRDDFSRGVLNLLQRQSAQVLLLYGDEDGQVSWLAKQPLTFTQAVLLEAGKKSDAFDEVVFDNDLSTVDMDFNEYLQKSGSANIRNAIKIADEAFNKDAIRLQKGIEKWTKKLDAAKGDDKDECDYQKMRLEKQLSRSVSARKSVIEEAFRSGKISEYYYRQRVEQLELNDFSKVPEMFEVDSIKNKSDYLKEHDLQDLSKAEADEIIKLATIKAIKDKKLYLAKEFLAQKGLASSKRYTMKEMGIDNGMFYRTLAAGKKGNSLETSALENNDSTTRISVDLDECEKDDVTYVFTGYMTEPIKNK